MSDRRAQTHTVGWLNCDGARARFAKLGSQLHPEKTRLTVPNDRIASQALPALICIILCLDEGRGGDGKHCKGEGTVKSVEGERNWSGSWNITLPTGARSGELSPAEADAYLSEWEKELETALDNVGKWRTKVKNDSAAKK